MKSRSEYVIVELMSVSDDVDRVNPCVTDAAILSVNLLLLIIIEVYFNTIKLLDAVLFVNNVLLIIITPFIFILA